jgi:biopolymer transport protein ExbB/TolQ
MTEEKTDRLVRVLDWNRMDAEQRMGFRGGKYTDVNLWLSFFIGVIFWLLFYGSLMPVRDHYLGKFFMERSITQYLSVFFTCWSAAILLLKWRKLVLQRKTLQLMIVPHSQDFVLAPATAGDILRRMYDLVDDPKNFVLLNRTERALSNLSNIGLISDVSEMLRAQAENDEDHMESSYSMIKGFIWGIPVLGFIGTVLGLSQAIGQFSSVMAASDIISNLKTSLQGVTKGLATAFDTTLLALVAALTIQLLLTALKKKEEYFLDECKDYCHANIISKLRLIQTQPAQTEPSA